MMIYCHILGCFICQNVKLLLCLVLCNKNICHVYFIVYRRFYSIYELSKSIIVFLSCTSQKNEVTHNTLLLLTIFFFCSHSRVYFQEQQSCTFLLFFFYIIIVLGFFFILQARIDFWMCVFHLLRCSLFFLKKNTWNFLLFFLYSHLFSLLIFYFFS